VPREGIEVALLDLKEIRRRAQAALDWDGGCALPPDVPAEVILALLDEIERLRDVLRDVRNP